MSETTSTLSKPNFLGLDHLKLPAKDLLKTTWFYTEVLPFKRELKWDHKTHTPESRLFATMLSCHELGDITMEIRHNEDWAEKTTGVDHITWRVPTRKDLEHWQKWFVEKGVKRSNIFTGMKGWVLCAEDPDRRIVRVVSSSLHSRLGSLLMA